MALDEDALTSQSGGGKGMTVGEGEGTELEMGALGMELRELVTGLREKLRV